MRKLIAGNWKMFKTAAEARVLARAIREGMEGSTSTSCDVVIAPPFTALSAVASEIQGSRVGLAAQNMHEALEGAFTGEISPVMLKDAGATHVILGHSERRHIFGETDLAVMHKARAAWDHALTPILCTGETLGQRETSRTFDVVGRHIEHALRHVTPDEAAKSVIAYEPVWAIGTGHTATPEQAQEVHRFIRKTVAASHGEGIARAVRILYGGSVKPENIAGLVAQPDVDGALVGGACLKADSFLGIVLRAGGPHLLSPPEPPALRPE